MRKQLAVAAAGIVIAAGLGLGTASTASAMTNSSDCGYYSTSEPQLSINDSGASVKALQCELNTSMANTSLSVDGVFGSNTYNAVIKFQGCAHLAKDGIVGPKTWQQLDWWSVYGGGPIC
ncbi:peptidoglycan-binding protein [Streptacidiphilus sp. EB129]|uniref:peptidoglycan-binding domain-containing protein n=1 Tax=Streptacidiphilus sp. EB129 TaxID=3156262 RepID=UPI0035183083